MKWSDSLPLALEHYKPKTLTLYKWEALSYKHVPVYAEMPEGSTLETCMKADRWWRCVRGTPNTRFR